MQDDKYRRLQQILTELESVVVAFSGGVDSTLLLRAALDTLGPDRVLAVTADSETYPSEELEDARSLAEQLGVRHEVVYTSELAIPGYAENTANRCYFCKQNLFTHLVPLLEERGYRHVVYGLIADDLGEHRPGTRAAAEFGVRAPLQEAGLSKDEVREHSRRLGLQTWDKPSFACLSSRVAYGDRITALVLDKIDRSERYLRKLGIRQVRVRTHGDTARIEVEPRDMALLAQRHEEVAETLKSYGYRYVSLDLTGYRSGSMNAVLTGTEAEHVDI